MIRVDIDDDRGTRAEFRVSTPVVALDLALHAERAGLRWAARDERHGAGRVLPLDDLRTAAARHAAGDPGAAAHLRATEAGHRAAALASLS
jgi:hypothetical protein